MSVGNRIRYFRQKNGWKQKELGLLVGLTDVSAEVRINQYESGARTPRPDMMKKLADVFHISPLALIDSDVYSGIGFMHTMFAIEDTYDLELIRMGNDVLLRFKGKDDSVTGKPSVEKTCLLEWAVEYTRLQNGEITQEEYDSWRYNFPEEYIAEVEKQYISEGHELMEDRMPPMLLQNSKYARVKQELIAAEENEV